MRYVVTLQAHDPGPVTELHTSRSRDIYNEEEDDDDDENDEDDDVFGGKLHVCC